MHWRPAWQRRWRNHRFITWAIATSSIDDLALTLTGDLRAITALSVDEVAALFGKKNAVVLSEEKEAAPSSPRRQCDAARRRNWAFRAVTELFPMFCR